MLKNLADMFRGLFGRRTRKFVSAQRRRDFLNQFRKGRLEGLEDRALMAQLLAFDFTGENSGPVTSTAEIVGANLDSSPLLTRGPGAAASTANNSFRTTGFQNNGISTANTDYFQVELSAAAGHELDLSSVDARFAGTATYAASPGVSHQFAYSLDGTNFTLIGSPVTTTGTPATLPQIDLSGVAALQDVADGVTVTLRYYASGQTSTGGWGFFSSAAGVYGLDIGGTVAPAASATSTTTALTSVTPLTVDQGQLVSFSGTVVAGSGSDTPTGTIEIRNAGPTGTLLASTPAIGGSGVNGTFSINSTTVPIGTYDNIQAFYVPGSGFTASSSSVFGSTLTVNAVGASTTTSLTSISPLTANAGDAVTFIGTVVAGSGAATPAGTIEIRDGGASGTLLASTASIGGSGVNGTYNFSFTAVPVGTYNNIQAFFLPSTGFLPSSSSVFGDTLTVATVSSVVSFTGATYTQDFDALGASTVAGIAPVGTVQYLNEAPVSQAALNGWSVLRVPQGTNTGPNLTAGTGSSNAGGLYNFATGGAPNDRALGNLFSGNHSARIGVVIQNNSTETISTVTIAYDSEQYRRGGGSTNPDRLDFQYQVGATDIGSEGTWIDVDALDATSVNTSNSAVTSIDGNADGLSAKSAVINIVGGWAPGQKLVIRWNEFDVGGSDDGLAIDNFSLSVPSAESTATTTTLGSVTPGTISQGEAVTFSGTVVAGAGSDTPTGTIEIRNGGAGGTLLATTTTIGGSGVNGTFSIESTTVPVGFFDNIQAFYLPSTGFLPSSSSIFGSTLTVEGVPSYVSFTGATYTQDFDALGTSTINGIAPVDTVQYLNEAPVNKVPLNGWSVLRVPFGNNTGPNLTAGTGSTTGGGLYNFATEAAPNDRALGNLLSGNHSARIGVVIQNDSSETFTTITIAYDSEQYRRGGGSTTADRLDFQYQVGATDIGSEGTWIDVDALDATSVDTSFEAVSSIDGNAAGLSAKTAVFNIAGGWSPGQKLVIRWNEFNVTGSDDGLAIDNFSLSVPSTEATGTTTTLDSVTSGTINQGDSVTFSGTVVAVAGADTPIGTIEIRNGGAGGTLLASTTTIGGSGVNGTFNFSSTTVPVGFYDNIQAFYLPGPGFSTSSSVAFGSSLTIVPAVTNFVSYSTPGSTYTQDFNSLATLGTSAVLPTGWALAESGANADSTYNTGDGSGNGGNTYSFGTGTDSDRAFGTLQSGTLIPVIGVAFKNTTGVPLSSFTLSYTGEQWRLGTLDRLDQLDFQYSLDATSLSSGTWFDFDGLDFVSQNTGPTVGALDGNAEANRLELTGTIDATIPANSILFIRWNDANASGADDGLAIDDLTFSAVGDGGGENVAPTINPQSFSVAESAATGATVGTIVATDANPGQALSYAFVVAGSPTQVSGPFTISATTGQITVTGALDFETTATYSTTVRVTDNGSPALFSDGAVTINVDDRSEGRVFIPATLTATAGSSVMVPVNLQVTEVDGAAVSSAVIRFTYDSTKLTFSTISLTGGPLAGFTLDSSGSTPGNLVFTATGTAGATIPSGTTVTLANVTFNVAAGAAAGPTALNLQAATNISDATPNLFGLSPAVTNGADANVDGTVTIGAGPLAVTSITQTPTGVFVQLNRPADPALVNLYDQGGALGAADVTLVGTNTGAVRGSLVFNATNDGFTFIKTGMTAPSGAVAGASPGTLEADTYTLTLRSAANGFVDLEGNLLRDVSGVSVGNYINTFTVNAAAPNAVTLSIPDFARGFGQAVNVPNTSTGLPIVISNANNVGGVDLVVHYNPALLTITGVTSPIPGASVGFNIPTPGTINIQVSSAGAFATSAGALTIANLISTVPASAPYSSKQIISFASILVRDTDLAVVPSLADNAVHVAAFFDDMNADQAYDSADTILVQRLGVGTNTGASAYQTADPYIVGDALSDFAFDSADTITAQRLGVGTPVPAVPALPDGAGSGVLGGPDPELSIGDVTATSGAAGTFVFVPVNLLVTELSGITLAGIDLVIQFDPSRFEITGGTAALTIASETENGLIYEGSPYLITDTSFSFGPPAIDNALGQIRLQATNPGDGVVSSNVIPHLTQGTLLFVRFRIKPGAASGTSVVNLRATPLAGGTGTRLRDNDLDALTLVPAPTNADTDDVDGSITIPGVANAAPTALSLAPTAIAENAGANAPVGTFTTTDPNSGDTFTYSLVSGTGSTDNGLFNISGNTLRANSSFDFETSGTYSVRVRSTDQGGLFFDQTFTITVTNVNEAPTIDPQTFSVAENVADGTVVGTVVASDVDAGDSQIFAITAGNDSGAFAIDPSTGAITVANSSLLDFEATPSYSLTVSVTDGGSLSASTAVTINLSNVNEAPTFGLASYSFSLAENSATGTAAGAVSATDPDAGASLVYSLSGIGASNFDINPTTGAITVAAGATLNFEGTSSFSLTANVTDGANPVSVPVVITLTNVNENPIFSPNTAAFAVGENAANETVVGTVTAQDPDADDTQTYAITAGNGTGAGAFAINSTTGQITVADSAQMTAQTYTLTVTSTDALGLTGTITVSISVSANLAPTFDAPSYTFSVAENSGTGIAVGTVAATDPELATLIYGLTGSSNFEINPSTGAITVAAGAVLDFEGTNSFSLTASVNDGFLTTTVPVTVNLTNVNEAPSLAPQTFSVPENSANGAAVGTVIASDIDAGDTQSFAITGGNAAGGFAINPTTGAITVANGSVLNFEVTPSYSLTVSVTDGGGLSASNTVTINLTDVNEAPTIAPQTFSVAENSADSSAVGTVAASDVDAGDTQTFAIIAGNDSGAFAINPTTGAVTVANGSLLDFESLSSYALTVSVTDAGLLSTSNTVTINLTDVNEAPTIAPQTFSVAENSANGTAVGTVVASDVDAGDSQTFAITAGNAAGAFTINPTTGAITVANGALLDFEGTPSYSLTVSVTDGGGLSASNTVTINVANVNEAPVVTPTTATIAENSLAGTVVAQIFASDPDFDLLSYSLSGPGSAAFAVNASGQITVVNAAALDYETVSGHVFNLIGTATDGGSLFGTAPVTITLSDVNEAPSFNAASYSFSVLDTAAVVGTVVGTVAASDVDAGASLTYSITAGNGTGAGAFAINPTTGQITVNDNTQISYLNPPFALTVQVSDGSLTSTVPVTVEVTHSNHAPTFLSLSNNSFAENSIPNTVVGSFATTDADLPSDSHVYTLVGGTGSADNAHFNIFGNQLRTTSANFDYETKSIYQIRVRTTDRNGTGASYDRVFTIAVTDVAESGNQAPTNIVLSGDHKISPTATAGTPVGNLTTSDPNPGDTFNYTLGGADASKFIISGSALRLASNVTDPVGTVYHISVTSTDQFGLSKTVSFDLTVAVPKNVAPTFLALTLANVGGIPENSGAGAVVGNFATTDANIGDVHSYSLVPGTGSTDNSQFTIVGSELRANADFNFELKSSYQIRVRTTDQGSLSYDRVFTIAVTNVNEAPTSIVLTGSTVAQSAPVNTQVGILSALDPDGSLGLTFALVAGAGSTDNANFTIASGNRLRTTSSYLGNQATYSIRVRVTDALGLNFEQIFTITRV